MWDCAIKIMKWFTNCKTKFAKPIGKPKSDELLFIKSQVRPKFTTYDRNHAGTKTNYVDIKKTGWWYSRKNPTN